jgi:hypothetical protein
VENGGRRHAGDDLAGDADVDQRRLGGKQDVDGLLVGRLDVGSAAGDAVERVERDFVAARRRSPVHLDDLGADGGEVVGERSEAEVDDRQPAVEQRRHGRDAGLLSHRAPAFLFFLRAPTRSRILVASAQAWWFEGMTTQPAASSFAFCCAKFCGSPAVPVIEARTGR